MLQYDRNQYFAMSFGSSSYLSENRRFLTEQESPVLNFCVESSRKSVFLI